MKGLFINPTNKTIHSITIHGFETFEAVLKSLLECDEYIGDVVNDFIFYHSFDAGDTAKFGFQTQNGLFILGNAIAFHYPHGTVESLETSPKEFRSQIKFMSLQQLKTFHTFQLEEDTL